MAKIHLLEELCFWFPYIEAFNVYGTQPKFSPGAVIFCDASDYAFGGFQVGFAYVYRVLDAHGKFGEHEKCVRVARGAAESNSSFLRALQTSQVHP